MLAMVGREVPFVSGVFFIRPLVTKSIYQYWGSDTGGGVSDNIDGGSDTGGGDSAMTAAVRPAWWKTVHLEVAAGFLTSALTSPISQAPSVVSAYQQGHGVGLKQACTELYRQGGYGAFFRGLLPRTLAL